VLAEKRPLRKLRDDDSKLAAAKADRSIFTNAVAALTKRRAGWKRRLPPPTRSAPRSTCRSTKG
jgi:hypothetical protein